MLLNIERRRRSEDIFQKCSDGGAVFQTVVYNAAITTRSTIHSALLRVVCVNREQQPNVQHSRALVCLRLEMSELYREQRRVLFAEGNWLLHCESKTRHQTLVRNFGMAVVHYVKWHWPEMCGLRTDPLATVCRPSVYLWRWCTVGVCVGLVRK